MSLHRRIAALVLAFASGLASLVPGRAVAREPGSIEGTIDLRTHLAHGPARIPPGARLEVVVLAPDGRHDIGVGRIDRTTPEQTSVPYRIDGLPVGTPLRLHVTVTSASVPNLPYFWAVRFHRTGTRDGSDGPVTLTSARPNASHIDFDARGATIPAQMPTARTSPPTSGSIFGKIELNGGDATEPLSVAPEMVRVVVTRTDTQARVGRITLGPLLHASATARFLDLRIDALPLEVPLTVSVEAPPTGPFPTGFLNLVRFRPKSAQDIEADTFALTLTATKPTYGLVDFVPYALEVPPLPPRATATATSYVPSLVSDVRPFVT
jgi:hypothetical protein